MNTLGDRIKLARGNISQEAFSRALKISKGSLGFSERNENLPNVDVALKICSKTGVRIEWLLLGRGPMRQEGEGSKQAILNELSKKTDEIVGKPDDLIMIPLVEAVLSAGGGSFETSAITGRDYAFRRDFIQRKGNPSDMILMRVSGDSMEPDVLEGDVVLIDQGKTKVVPGKMYAVGFDECIYLKRIDSLPGKVILKSANPAYPPVELDVRGDLSEHFRVIGRVLWVGREYK